MGIYFVKELVNTIVVKYHNQSVEDHTNLFGVATVRSIVYILHELEEKTNFRITDESIEALKNLSIHNISNYLMDL